MQHSSTWRRLAIAADVLAVALIAAGTLALLGDDLSFQVFGVRVSMREPWRLYAWGVATLAVRFWLVRRPVFFAWVLGPFRREFRQAARARFVSNARDVLPLEERALFFTSPLSRGQRLGRFSLLLLGFAALLAVSLWPQLRQFRSVADLGDPLFYVWRIGWVGHQLTRNPLELFHANQFHPEPFTLTYSDSSLVPMLVSAPLVWLGLDLVVVYNILIVSSFVLSGAAMFLLVRALTDRTDAALIAGMLYALYPYRFEHYSHLDLLMTMWMPLALWGLHRTLAQGRLRDGLATGLAFAMQTLSALYYGCFLAVYMVVLGGAVWIGRGRPRGRLRPLAAGAVLAAVMIAPVASQYIASRPVMGTREETTIQAYSAVGPDYLQPTFRSRVYNRWSEGLNERELFPRLMPVVLSAVAVYPPLSVTRIAYVLALLVAFDGSLGFNGPTFTSLHAVLPPFQSLRVPARFSMLVGMTLSILAGFGAMRLIDRWPRWRVALAASMVALAVAEAHPRLPLQHVWDQPPPIYASIAGMEPPVLLAEFPMPRDVGRSEFDARYLYFSTFHWQNLVNGSSGFFPASYRELLEHGREFPSEASLEYLRSRGVQYVTMHGRFTNPERYGYTVGWLDARPDVELVVAAPWEGAESRLYRIQ